MIYVRNVCSYRNFIPKVSHAAIKTFSSKLTAIEKDPTVSELNIDPQEDQYPCVTLLKGKARLFQEGNPLIYGGAVKDVSGNPDDGDFVCVRDHMGNMIGKGK